MPLVPLSEKKKYIYISIFSMVDPNHFCRWCHFLPTEFFIFHSSFMSVTPLGGSRYLVGKVLSMGISVSKMSPCMFVQLFKLLSAEGMRQLARRSGRKINTIILPLKKKA